MMRYPRYVLSGRVLSISVIDGDREAHVLPGTAAVLGFQRYGHVRTGERILAPAGVTGIQRTVRTYGYARPTRSILVRFTPQGATCLGAPASELASRSVGLDEIVRPARAREVITRVGEARSDAEAVAVVEAFLGTLPYAPDPLVARALDMLDPAGGGCRVAAVARRLAISERQLERRFRDRVGISPGQFAGLRRFERAAELATRASSLTDVAFAAGYYDQPHFIREFRRFAGVAPRDWLRMSDLSK
jgi:AraC-like DNA-binding protein